MVSPVPHQLPQGVQQPVAAETALQVKPGQVVEARVLGTGQGANTQLSINGQVVEAALAARLSAGTLIHLLAQGSGPSLRFTVQQPPAPASSNAAQAGQAQAAQPPAQGQASVGSNTASNVAVRPAGVIPQAQVAPTNTAPGSASNAQASQNAQGAAARPVLVANTGPSSAAQPGAQLPANAQASRANPAPLPSVASAGSAPQANSSALSLQPGTVLRVAVQGSGVTARPVLVPASTPAATGAQQAAQAISTPQSISPVQQALVQAVQGAVVRQDNISVLLSSLAGLGAKLSELPKPVQQAVQDVLGNRLSLDGKPVDGKGLQQALARSGLFYEGKLPSGQDASSLKTDLKGQLLKLAQVLKGFVGDDSAHNRPNANRPPPPVPGSPPRAERPVSLPPLPNGSAAETGARLLGQADAALSRIRLLQVSSLPDSSGRMTQGAGGQGAELNIEIPLSLGAELSMGHFQILQDGEGKAGREADGTWKMRFAINFSQTGEVGATVSYRGGKTGVMLWAEREETAEILDEMLPELALSLEARGLEPGAIRIRHGAPPERSKPVGAYMDNSS